MKKAGKKLRQVKLRKRLIPRKETIKGLLCLKKVMGEERKETKKEEGRKGGEERVEGEDWREGGGKRRE